MKHIFKIFNNGKEIGKVNSNVSNFQKLMVLSAIGFTVLTTTGCSQDKEIVIETEEEINVPPFKEYSEPRYKVEYKIEYGDNLTSLVYSYESDTNKVYKYIDEIVRENDLDSRNSLRQGNTITLIGVPESKLADFGYSADYSLFDPEYELMDRADFINSQAGNIYESDFKKTEIAVYKAKVLDLENMLQDYINEQDPETKTYLLDYLLEGYREACDMLYGICAEDFEFKHPAYPLSEALNNNLEPSY